MKSINLIFPHQLFQTSPLDLKTGDNFLIEEFLFFDQFNFHKQKILFHRASMKYYEAYLKSKSINVTYIEANEKNADVRKLLGHLARSEVKKIQIIDPCDDWLEQRIQSECHKRKIELVIHDSPLYLNTRDELSSFFKKDKKSFFQTKWYIGQRKKRNILLEEGDAPKGGKWSFDAENRKKYPRKKVAPHIAFPDDDAYYKEAKTYVEKHFSKNPGDLGNPIYPIHHKSSLKWLDQFLKNRFLEFGPYEDAIVSSEHWLNHSILTPMLNVGLLTPHEIIRRTLKFIENNDIPINSFEGFIRQIIGWREFIRGIYITKGREERTKNYWGFTRKIPSSFYTGTTGIIPIDVTIKKVLRTGYCHHIERLMVLGNFMLLCEFDPDEVYRWFMELFIDAYDWVMVPNVYGMSQFADGGMMSTKPYISGSNYILKMSDYKKGDWSEIWDALFWHFINKQRAFFLKNHRSSMMVRLFDKQSPEKQNMHKEKAESYLSSLDN